MIQAKLIGLFFLLVLGSACSKDPKNSLGCLLADE